MLRAGGEVGWLKIQTLEFGTKYKGWQKPAEINDVDTPYESHICNLSQFEMLRHGYGILYQCYLNRESS